MSEIQALRTLLIVVETGSFHRAAAAMNVSQPAVTKRIRTLETAFRCRLLDRSGKRILLTEQGEHVAREAREIVQRYMRLQLHLTKGEGLSLSLELGVVEAVLLSWFPDFMIALRRRYPGVDINLHCHPTVALQAKDWIPGKSTLRSCWVPSNDGSRVEVPLTQQRMCFAASPSVGRPASIHELRPAGPVLDHFSARGPGPTPT